MTPRQRFILMLATVVGAIAVLALMVLTGRSDAVTDAFATIVGCVAFLAFLRWV